MRIKQSSGERRFQEKVMSHIMAVTEHAAGEVFRWLTWALAVGALDVVRVRTGADWLLWIEWFLGSTIWLRIAWRLGPKPREGTPTEDGGQVLTFGRAHLLAGLGSMLATMGIIFIGAEIVRLVAAANLLAR